MPDHRISQLNHHVFHFTRPRTICTQHLWTRLERGYVLGGLRGSLSNLGSRMIDHAPVTPHCQWISSPPLCIADSKTSELYIETFTGKSKEGYACNSLGNRIKPVPFVFMTNLAVALGNILIDNVRLTDTCV